MNEIVLSADDARSAVDIQAAIDGLADCGGTVILPSVEVELDRGLELHSGITLAGQGSGTILRHAVTRVYPLTGYHNYGMCDVPLGDTAGLCPGMTVSIHDDRTRGNFYGTFARITWIDGAWVGLDSGLNADYQATASPRLVTRFPLVYAHNANKVAIRNLVVRGEKEESIESMNACRGAALYLYQCGDVDFDNVEVRDYNGEGLGFQMCRDVRISDSRFTGNSGNGIHPGAGSTNVLTTNCVATHNGKCGFYFCVRANHITVRDCEFAENRGHGVSIGTRDCHNVIDNCFIHDNDGAGIATRPTAPPIEVHSCAIRGCDISGNGRQGKVGQRGQIELRAATRDVSIEGCRISGGNAAEVGILLEAGVSQVSITDNQFSGLQEDVRGPVEAVVRLPSVAGQGYGVAGDAYFRHLPKPGGGE